MHYQDERTYGCRISDSWTYRGLKMVVMENELFACLDCCRQGRRHL